MAFANKVEEYSHDGLFRYTTWWNDAIAELKDSFGNSKFTGCEVVNVLYKFAVSNSENVARGRVTRDKIVKLCQKMLDSKVMRSETENKDPVFWDSNKSYYVVVHSSCSDQNASFLPLTSRLCHVAPDKCSERKPDLPTGMLDITALFNKLRMTESKGPSAEKAPELRPSICSNSSTMSSPINSSYNQLNPKYQEVLNNDDLMHDLSLHRLLAILDIPVLDAILHVEFKRTYSSQAHVSGVSKCGSILQEVLQEWNLCSDKARKRRLYASVVSCHESLSSTLIPSNYCEIIRQIYSIFCDGKLLVAIEASQLLLLLLPGEIRKTLSALLSFMRHVSLDGSVRLDAELSNIDYVLNTLGQFLFKFCADVLSERHSLAAAEFFIVNCSSICTIPVWFLREALVLSDLIKLGNAEQFQAVTYCKRISSDEFNKQTKQASDDALVALLNSVLDSTSLTRREKEAWLKRFETEHRDLFKSLSLYL